MRLLGFGEEVVVKAVEVVGGVTVDGLVATLTLGIKFRMDSRALPLFILSFILLFLHFAASSFNKSRPSSAYV